MKKCILLCFFALGIALLSGGCAGLSAKSSRAQEERLALIDQRIRELEQGLSALNISAQKFENRAEELSQRTADTDANYSKLLTVLDGLSSRFEMKDSSFENILEETQKNISGLEKKLNEIEKAKIDLQNQLMSLQTQRTRLIGSKIDQHAEAMKEGAKEMVEQGRAMVKEATTKRKSEEDKEIEAIAANHEKEALQKLLDDALTHYRDGNYSEAIGKWEEVLVIDPENLEAKFNIEIAKEKMKSVSEK